jgi:hypothetical protein
MEKGCFQPTFYGSFWKGLLALSVPLAAVTDKKEKP